MADTFNGFELQRDPGVFVAAIPGDWLLRHSTTSWRIRDPKEGFQRMVDERRARAIAAAVLAQNRTFPNAIVLATNSTKLTCRNSQLKVPPGIKFLVVDGQHRLRAQEFASFVADYACIIHVGLTEAEMGRLFLEINDTQKRVPASLRWDLVRLVQPAEDKASLRAADLIFELATDTDSPLFLRIDLTGERQKIALKQGSIAPEVKRLVGPKGGLRDQSYEEQSHILRVLFWTLRERDVDGWEDATGPLYKARVIRGLLNVLPDLLDHIKKPIMNMAVNDLLKFLRRVDLATLSDAELKTQHGNAGIAAIRDTIKEQLFR